MKYSTANLVEAVRAKEYLQSLIDKKVTVEVKRVVKRRSLPQNNYLHLLLSAFGLHFGISTQTAKNIYKAVNEDIYLKKVTLGDSTFTDVRSSADLNTAEMARSIDRFREFSMEQDYPLPLATDEAAMRSLENAVEQAQHYL